MTGVAPFTKCGGTDKEGKQVCAFGGWLCFVLQGLHGLGRHQRIIDPLDLIQMNHVGFWQSIISATGAMALLKVSIALNLLRLSPSRWYTWSLWSSIGMIILSLAICSFDILETRRKREIRG